MPARENRIRRFKMLFDGFGFQAGPILQDMADAYGVGRATGTRLFQDVKPLLDYMVDKYRLGVITEGSVETQREQLQGQKIEGYFEVVVISGETPWHKPDKNLYQLAATKLKTETENIVMVGDRLDWDIGPAKEIGMQTVYLDRGQSSKGIVTLDPEPDYVVFDLNELQCML